MHCFSTSLSRLSSNHLKNCSPNQHLEPWPLKQTINRQKVLGALATALGAGIPYASGFLLAKRFPLIGLRLQLRPRLRLQRLRQPFLSSKKSWAQRPSSWALLKTPSKIYIFQLSWKATDFRQRLPAGAIAIVIIAFSSPIHPLTTSQDGETQALAPSVALEAKYHKAKGLGRYGHCLGRCHTLCIWGLVSIVACILRRMIRPDSCLEFFDIRGLAKLDC